MKIEIEIDEERIARLVEEMIAKEITEHYNQDGRPLAWGGSISRGVKEGMDKAVQSHLYKNKDAIIERVVERASKEMVRKGLPKFLATVSGKVAEGEI